MKKSHTPIALLSSITSDSHTWNLIFIQLLLEENGYEVINLGSCTPISEIIKSAHKYKPLLHVVSTVNGHGYSEGIEIITEIKKCAMLKNMTNVIGGKLDTNNGKNSVNEKLLNSGFHKIFNDDNSIHEFIIFINNLNNQKILCNGIQ